MLDLYLLATALQNVRILTKTLAYRNGLFADKYYHAPILHPDYATYTGKIGR